MGMEQSTSRSHDSNESDTSVFHSCVSHMSDVGTSEHSMASSLQYPDAESFENLKSRVRRLCRHLWPDHDDEDVEIERMKGGSYNRVIGISVKHIQGGRRDVGKKCKSISQQVNEACPITPKTALPTPPQGQDHSHHEEVGDAMEDQEINRAINLRDVDMESGPPTRLPPGDYILRIPRYLKESKVAEQAAMLDWIKGRITLPVPAVVHTDASASDQNFLGTPYSLQERIRGKLLQQAWPRLSHHQRLLIVLEVARFHKELMSITNISGGVPDLEQGPAANGALFTRDLEHPEDKKEGYPVTMLVPQRPVDMIDDRMGRWWRWAAANKFPPAAYGDVKELMIPALQDVIGTFGPDDASFFLCHSDLWPRNIMVETIGDNIAYITGILDWDLACFLPGVLSMTPPAWLWTEGSWKDPRSEGYVDEKALLQYREPESAEDKEIKALFDAVVGPEFCDYAYVDYGEQARLIWESIRWGFFYTSDYETLDQIFNTWWKEVEAEGQKPPSFPSESELSSEDDEEWREIENTVQVG